MLPEDQPLERSIQHVKQPLSHYLLEDYSKASHITLYAAGFLQGKKRLADDVTKAILDQQEQRIRKLLLSNLQLQTHAVNSFQAAPFIEVLDDKQGSLESLHQSLSEAFGNDRDGKLTPHITLGLYKKAFETADVAQHIARQPQSPLVFHVNNIHLLAYRSDDIRSPLQSLRCIKLNQL